jgi:hypothetical protein
MPSELQSAIAQSRGRPVTLRTLKAGGPRGSDE